MSLIPLPERGGVDLHDAGLHQGLGAHQLIVGSIVDHVDDTGLACHA